MSRFVRIDITNYIARNVIIPLTHKAEFVNPQIDAPWKHELPDVLDQPCGSGAKCSSGLKVSGGRTMNFGKIFSKAFNNIHRLWGWLVLLQNRGLGYRCRQKQPHDLLELML